MKMFGLGPANARFGPPPPQLRLRLLHFRPDRLRHGDGDEKTKPFWWDRITHAVWRNLPGSKLQAPEEHHEPGPKKPRPCRRSLGIRILELGIWNLGFLWSFEFGV